MNYIEGLTARYHDLTKEIERLQIKRTLIGELLDEASRAEYREEDDAAETSDSHQRNGTVSMGATEAIFDYVSRHPGSRGVDIVDGIIDRVSMRAKDPRRSLFSIISTLRRREKLLKDADGKFHLADK